VKFLFTSDNLSVQVHPEDEYAQAHENGSAGKTEMWHVLRAEPGARIAVGLKKAETAAQVREAALSGEIVDLLRWVEVHPGETYFLPAGTIHAIGAGLVLCEVQQLSDVTYRLYDFGRGRELHLEKALAVAHFEPYDALVPRRGNLLAECEYFRTERMQVQGSATLEGSLCIVLEGEGTFGGMRFAPGDGFEGPATVESPNAVFLVTGAVS
jgi:mannose-6-phosphate isomerase